MGDDDPKEAAAAKDEQEGTGSSGGAPTEGPGGVTVDEPTDPALSEGAESFGMGAEGGDDGGKEEQDS